MSKQKFLTVTAILMLLFFIKGNFAVGALVGSDTDPEEALPESPRSGEVAMAAMPDGWGEDMRVTSGSLDASGATTGVDSQNNLHVIWNENIAGHRRELFYKKYDSFGKVLVDDKQITSATNFGGAESPQMVIDASDNAHVVWNDDRNEINADEIYYKKLDNNGNTLVNDKRLTSATGWSWVDDVAIDAQNNIHIIFTDVRSGGWKIYYEKLNSSGSSVVNDKLISNTWSAEGSLSVDSLGNLHVAFISWGTGNNEIFYTKLNNSGSNVVDDLRLTNTAAASNSPAINVDFQDNVHIVWSEGIPSGAAIYYTKLTTSGSMAIPPTAVTGTNSVFPSLVYDWNGIGHLTWTEGAVGNEEIYYTQITIDGVISSPSERLTDNSSYSRYPNLTLDLRNEVFITWNDYRDGYWQTYLKRTYLHNAWQAEQKVTTTTTPSEYPLVLLDQAGNNNVIWTENVSGTNKVYFKKISPSGDLLVNDTLLITSASETPPAVATDSQFRIHIVWKQSDASGQFYSYTQFDQNGNKVQGDLRLTNDILSYDISIAIDKDDNVHFIRLTYESPMFSVHYMKLDTAGTVIVPDKRVSDISTSLYNTTIDTDSLSNVHIAWSDVRDGQLEIYYRKLNSIGDPLTPDLRLTNAPSYSQEPRLLVDSIDEVHIVWADSRSSTYDLYYKKLDSSGVELVADTFLDSAGTDTAPHPFLAIDKNNKIHIVYNKKSAYFNYEVFYFLLNSDGTINRNARVSLKPSTISWFPALAVNAANEPHVVWADSRESNYELYYSRSLLGQINGKVIEIGTTIPVEGAVVIAISNNFIFNGDTSDTNGSFEIVDLPSGTYDLKASKNGRTSATISGNVLEQGEQQDRTIEIAPAPTADVVADGIDVLQSVETDSLIVDKPTVIRVRSHVSGLDTLAGVQAQLHVVGPSIDTVFIKHGEIKKNYTGADTDRGDEAFEFYYTPANSGTYTFTVTMSSADIVDANPANNSVTVSGKEFSVTHNPSILVVPIKINSVSPSVRALDSSWQFTRRAFPLTSHFVAVIDPQPAIENSSIIQDGMDEADTLLRLFAYKTLHALSYDYVAGVLPDGAINNGDKGFSNPTFPVTVSMASDSNPFALENAFAHELYHVAAPARGEEYQAHAPFGLTIDPAEKPFDAYRKIPARSWFDFTSQTVKTGTYRRSLRGVAPQPYEQGYEMAWIRRENYDTLVNRFRYPFLESQTVTEGDFLLVSIIIEDPDTVTMEPVLRTFGDYDLPVDDPEGTYELSLEDSNGGVLNSYRYTPTSIVSESGESTVSLFSFTLPADVQIDSIKVKKDGIVLAERSASVSPPQVSVTYPNGGESLTGTQVVTWDASDSDSDQLTYAVLLSTDSGATYTPLGVDIHDAAFTWDTNLSAGCTGTCKIKVIATDGFFTAEDESNGVFSSQTHGPDVSITSPIDDGSFAVSQEVIFEGNAYDLEDGRLSGSQLTWSSDIDGVFGTGEYLTVDSLSPGSHTVTLAVQDSSSNVSQVSVQITVADDTDGDGMPDNWETQYGLNASFDDSQLDPDQDGSNNANEYFSDTNPVVWQLVLQPFRDIVINETQTVRIFPQVSNPDAVPLQYSIDSNLFTWDNYYYYWKTNEASSGVRIFRVTATDGNTSDFQHVRVIVNDTCKVYNKKMRMWDCDPRNVHNNIPPAF